MKAKRAEKLRLAAVSILAAALLVCMSFAFTFAFAEEGELSFPNAGFEDSGSEATSWTLGTYLNGKDPDKADIRFDIVSGDEAYEGNSLKISNASTEDIHALVTAAAIPVYKLVFTVLAQSEDNSLFDAADLDAGHKPAIGFILDFGDKNTGEIMDFC